MENLTAPERIHPMQEPFKFCSTCGVQNQLSARFCRGCGAIYESAPPPVITQRERLPEGLKLLTLLAVLVFGCAVFGAIFKAVRPDPSEPTTGIAPMMSPMPTLTPTPTPELPPAEHLAEAKKLLKSPQISGYYGAGRTVYEQAARHLNAIPPEAKEYKEAQRIFGAATKKRDREETAAAAAAKRAAIVAETAARKQGADSVERGLLSQGYDATVTVSGPENRTIKITYILMNRPTVYQLVEAGFLDQLRDQGFRKVIFSDGYDSTWWYNL